MISQTKKEEIRKIALKYNNRSEFAKLDNSAYQKAQKSGILNEICEHMGAPKNEAWKNEELAKIALIYTFKGEFQNENPNAYNVAWRRGILTDICKHMAEAHHYWTNKELTIEALKYKTRWEFQKNSSAYHVAINRGILDNICNHMEIKRSKWTFKELAQEALKYKTRTEFYNKSSFAYRYASKRNLLNDICNHMKLHATRWELSEIREEASKYKTRKNFYLSNGGAYHAAAKRGILDEVCSHMPKNSGTSMAEENILKEIKQIYPAAKKKLFKKLKIENPKRTRLELDIFIPELRKGIEFDGTYWHSFEGLKRSHPTWTDEDIINYHKIKDKYFKSRGITIIHIKEKDWINNKEKCLKRIFKFLAGGA